MQPFCGTAHCLAHSLVRARPTMAKTLGHLFVDGGALNALGSGDSLTRLCKGTQYLMIRLERTVGRHVRASRVQIQVRTNGFACFCRLVIVSSPKRYNWYEPGIAQWCNQHNTELACAAAKRTLLCANSTWECTKGEPS